MEPFSYYKVCPECGGEYEATAFTCVDCGASLVSPEEIARRQLPSSPDLLRLRLAPVSWIRALAEDLQRAGIRYHLDPRFAKDYGWLDFYVLPQDAVAAAAIDAARYQREVANSAGSAWSPLPGAPEARNQAGSVVDHSYKVCPRCGGEYQPAVGACVDCGVALVFPEELDRLEELEGRAGMPSSPDLIPLRWDNHVLLEALAADLEMAGVRHRFDRDGDAPPGFLRLSIRPEDRRRASFVDQSFFGPPSIPKTEMDERDLDAELGDVCPACGAPRPPGSEECRDCGLRFKVEIEPG